MDMKKTTIIILLTVLFLSPVAAKDSSRVSAFYLKYTSRGSMWPVSIQFTIDRDGKCVYEYRNRRTGDTKGFTTRLSRRDLAALKSGLLNKYNFFSLPKYQPGRRMIKDASTSFLTVSMSGKTRRIGGYAIGHFDAFEPVFGYIRTMIYNMRKKHLNAR